MTADRTPDWRAEGFPTIESIIETAQRTLRPELWDYASSGAETETTLRRNRAAFGRLAFQPRLLNGGGDRDVGTTLLGHSLELPVFPAPVGSLHRYQALGALDCARAARRAGTFLFLSSATQPALEEIAAEVDVPIALQLYLKGDRPWIADQVRQAEAAGCAALCYTADVTAPGHRERNLLNHFGGPQGASDSPGIKEMFGRQAAFTWEDLAWLRGLTELPFVLKGVTCAEDARLAIERGVDVIYVSNHGGRQLDHMRATIEILPEVIAAVEGRAEVIVDSGFIRGSDVVKAIAMGARAVGIGKLMVWSLAVGGAEALERTLTLLREEIHDLLCHLGVGALAELTPDHLRPASEVPPSAWVGFRPGGHRPDEPSSPAGGG